MKTISALVPRGPGHQFVFYGDCCSGIPGGPTEPTFARANAVIQRLQPPPEFIVFLGDHIAGIRSDADFLRAQWRHWLDQEMAWLRPRRIPLYHVTSNHDTLDRLAEQVWREIFPDLPPNGPAGQEQLAYWVRHGDLLLVCVHTCPSALGGCGHVECGWLDRILGENADARYKFVAGHYPVFPVNGYAESPLWRIVPKEGRAFWTVLQNRRVLAYLCSHVIAFDAQEHDGIVQLCSGGAGTSYGPGGFMGNGEYHHVVQAAVDAEGARLQSLDLDGQTREQFEQPLQRGLINEAQSPPALASDRG